MLQGHRDLKVYQFAYKLAMEIFSSLEALSRGRALFLNRSDSPIITKRGRQHR